MIEVLSKLVMPNEKNEMRRLKIEFAGGRIKLDADFEFPLIFITFTWSPLGHLWVTFWSPLGWAAKIRRAKTKSYLIEKRFCND